MNSETYKRANMMPQIAEMQKMPLIRCMGKDCPDRTNCERYSSLPQAHHDWASFYADLPGCGAYIPMNRGKR